MIVIINIIDYELLNIIFIIIRLHDQIEILSENENQSEYFHLYHIHIDIHYY